MKAEYQALSKAGTNLTMTRKGQGSADLAC